MVGDGVVVAGQQRDQPRGDALREVEAAELRVPEHLHAEADQLPHLVLQHWKAETLQVLQRDLPGRRVRLG